MLLLMQLLEVLCVQNEKSMKTVFMILEKNIETFHI
jgi:hypothetical protein